MVFAPFYSFRPGFNSSIRCKRVPIGFSGYDCDQVGWGPYLVVEDVGRQVRIGQQAAGDLQTGLGEGLTVEPERLVHDGRRQVGWLAAVVHGDQVRRVLPGARIAVDDGAAQTRLQHLGRLRNRVSIPFHGLNGDFFPNFHCSCFFFQPSRLGRE